MNPKLKRVLIIVAILIAIVLIWFIFFHKKEVPVTVQAEKPTTGYIAQSVTATGKSEPVDTVSVGTQISGILQYLYADFNSKVKKGELLAALDKSLLQATLDQYKANFRMHKGNWLFPKTILTVKTCCLKPMP